MVLPDASPKSRRIFSCVKLPKNQTGKPEAVFLVLNLDFTSDYKFQLKYEFYEANFNTTASSNENLIKLYFMTRNTASWDRTGVWHSRNLLYPTIAWQHSTQL